MSTPSQYIIALVILVLFSGLFSAIETAYSCASKIKLKNVENGQQESANKVLKVLEDFDKFLTTVLIGNNIVNIAAATIATLLFTYYFKNNGPTISTIVMTIIILLVGEITPKSIAKQIPERFAMKTVGFVQFVEFIFTPFTWFVSGWQWVMSKIITVEEEDSDIADELITMVDEAEKEGDLEEHESDLISAAIEFNDLDVENVLTPRVDIVAIDITTPSDEIEKTFRMNAFSRLPVYENSIDNIVGVIHEKDFYDLMYHNRGLLRRIIKPVIYTSGNTKISTLLKQLQASKLHLAVVLDEFGGTEGIITMEDIIEELVGEIWDEHDEVVEYYTKIDEDTYLVNCEEEIDRLFERFDIEVDEEDDDYITVSGWVIYQLGHIPEIGEEFDYKNLHVKVTKADKRKVLEVKVEIKPKEEEEEE